MDVIQRVRRKGQWAAGVSIAAALTIVAVSIAPAVAQRPAGGSWTPYVDSRLGFSFAYPANVFALHPSDPTTHLSNQTTVRSGVTFVSRDGKAWFQAAAYANRDNLTLAAYRARMLAGTYAGARINFERLTPGFLIMSGVRGGTEFYERVVFSCDGQVVNFWLLTYPVAENAIYDRIVEEVARTFQPVAGRERCQQALESATR